MDFNELVEKRYSCRQLSDKKVDRNLIDKIIEIANSAPTAVNMQPIKIFRVESQDARNAIKQVTRFDFGAPEFLVVGYDENIGWIRKYDERAFADIDAGIVATYIMLTIKDLGLDTTWVGHFDAPKLKALCPKLKSYELIAIFPIGYASDDAEPSPRHFERKKIEEISEII